MVPFSFAGHTLYALSEGALFWPTRSALIVADLHFEKASWFAGHGQMLPPYDSAATLSVIEALIARTAACEIWCLGDSFHDSRGVERLDPAVRARLERLIAGRRWTWITGNHDSDVGDAMGGEIRIEAPVDGLLLRHQAQQSEVLPELSGHFHPKFRVNIRGRHIARRCFVATDRKLILPALGALTGGLDAAHPEIMRAVGLPAQAMVALPDRLLRFPLAA